MLSCASSLRPEQLTVHVPPHFSGALRINTCVPDAPVGEITVDDQGLGKTGLCPDVDHTVEIKVIASDRQYRIASANIHIDRTGDGFATSIQAQLPK
jgi:hypothetical protein